MEKSTLLDNNLLAGSSSIGKQAYKNNGTVSLTMVALPDDYTVSDVSALVTVTTPLPSWYPNFLMVREADKSLVPTYQYNRAKTAARAIQFSRDNFANFPQDSVSSVVGYVDYLSSTRRRNYASVLLHDEPTAGDPRTGSAIFISEMLHYGGLPMTIDLGDDPDNPDCTTVDQITTGPYTARGWRYCPAELSATQNWKYHPGIIDYFDSLPGGDLIGNVTLTEIQNVIWTTEIHGFGDSGKLKGDPDNPTDPNHINFMNMINRFAPGGDLADVAIGDYVYIGTHGFIVVGWGPFFGAIDGIDYANTHPLESGQTFPIPYVCDFCYGTGATSTPDNTGWLQDPRPRPFYATAARVFQEKLRSDQISYLKKREVVRVIGNPGTIEPVYDNFDATQWQFYKLPSTIATSTLATARLYFMG